VHAGDDVPSDPDRDDDEGDQHDESDAAGDHETYDDPVGGRFGRR
jgi:hypothetical protein